MPEAATTAAPAATTTATAKTLVSADPKSAPVAATEEPTQEFIVNGKPVKLTAAQVKVAVQKGLFADQKLKSVDVLQNNTKSLIEKLKTPEGLIGILKDPSLGVNPKEVFKKLMASDIIDDDLKEEMSKWVYQNVVQTAKMTPEQLEKEKKLSDYERLKKADDARKSQELAEQQKAQVNQVYQAIRAEVTKQIVSDKTFPQTEGSIRAVVEKLRVMNKQGAPITVENITKALGLVKKDHILHQQALLDGIDDPEGLVALLGEARALKISRALVARLKSKEKVKIAETQETSTREKVTDRIDKRLGRTPQGYAIMDV